MGFPFQREGRDQDRHFWHPADDQRWSDEYLAEENERWRRIQAEQDRADLIAKTVRWHSLDECCDRIRAHDERSFQETYGREPLWP
jgi:hypothetical protein